MYLLCSVPDLQTLKKEITIVINEDQPEITASFIVPEYLLIGGPEGGGSEYFKAACRGEWKEASSRVIKLQEIDTEAFNSYVFWIHKDKVATNTDIGMEGVPHEKAAYPLMEKLVNLWLLGDRLADTKFRNEIMDATIGVIHGLEVVSDEQDPVFSAATTVLIWSNTTDGRALRRLVVDHYIHMVTLEEMRPQWDEFHPDFIKDLVMHGLKCSPYAAVNEEEDDPSMRNHCLYHEHDAQAVMCDNADLKWDESHINIYAR